MRHPLAASDSFQLVTHVKSGVCQATRTPVSRQALQPAWRSSKEYRVNTRPRTSLMFALVVLALLGVGHLFVPFVPDADKIPAVVVYGDVALGAVSLVAAYGLSKVTQWGRILTLIVASLNVLSAAPGVVSAPNLELRAVTATYVVFSLVIIALVALPSARKPSAQRAPAPQE